MPGCNAPNCAKIQNRPNRRIFSTIPKDITQNGELNEAIGLLPQNYNFEIYKSLWRIRRENAKRVALQFPEGLLIFSLIISDILEKFGGVDAFIFGDVTYGACCIDDFSAKSLACDLMIHYGHSCLVPITTTKMPTLYVFVEIDLNLDHFVETVKLNVPKSNNIAIGGTVQFINSVHEVKDRLDAHFKSVTIPRADPLSSGEVLGCTSPRLGNNVNTVIFVADGRFHLESLMIANPKISQFYRYNPYDKKLTSESYDFRKMKNIRKKAIDSAKMSENWGVILSTLGRQGNPKILFRILSLLRRSEKSFAIFLFSEISADQMGPAQNNISAWVQIGCPRLSIDWGGGFSKPLLNPYEAFVALGAAEWEEDEYPMDFYAKGGGGWTNRSAEQ